MNNILIQAAFKASFEFAEYNPGLTDYLGATLVVGVLMTGLFSLAFLDL